MNYIQLKQFRPRVELWLSIFCLHGLISPLFEQVLIRSTPLSFWSNHIVPQAHLVDKVLLLVHFQLRTFIIHFKLISCSFRFAHLISWSYRSALAISWSFLHVQSIFCPNTFVYNISWSIIVAPHSMKDFIFSRSKISWNKPIWLPFIPLDPSWIHFSPLNCTLDQCLADSFIQVLEVEAYLNHTNNWMDNDVQCQIGYSLTALQIPQMWK